MAICGHQFRGGDETDWILSTSVSCLDGSTTASKILQELFKKHCTQITNKTIRMKRQRAITVPETTSRTGQTESSRSTEETNENLIVRKLPGGYNFENFDESQHLNGCPVKWLYRKKLLDKNRMYKVGRLCYVKTANKEETKREKVKNVRDKTPIEVKIHKINLIEKYTSNFDESGHKHYLGDRSDELETHRKKLAAKLNWKLHDDSQDEYNLETSSEISSRYNYLPPRPLIGLKPLLSVLLAPQQEVTCCSLGAHLQGNPTKEKVGASLSIQSLDLPFLSSEKPRPKTTNTPRWGSKSSRLTKKLQIPSQITIKLGHNQGTSVAKQENNLKLVYSNPQGRKTKGRGKQTKTLSSLFYELKDKTNESVEYFEDMIRDLTMEEGQFKIQRFLNITPRRNFESSRGDKSLSESKAKLMEATSHCDELNIICGKVHFSQKPQRNRSRKKPEMGVI